MRNVAVLTRSPWHVALAVLPLMLDTVDTRAQEDEGEDSIPVEEPDTGGPPGAEETGVPELAPSAAEKPSGDVPPQVSETHLVQSGDTLWDLCSKYLNSPWYWPKIWSYNPQITNPHWIYPGNELRFYPSDEGAPALVDASSQVSIPEDEESDTIIPDAMDPDDLVKKTGPIEVGRIAPNSYFAAHVGFVSARAHEAAGEIVNAESESYLLSDYDKIYVKLKSAARKGENYAIYRTIKAVDHPITGEPFGYSVEIMGGLTIIDTSPSVATAQIAQAYRPIERGDFVGRWPENFGSRINPTANQAEAKGYIIETSGEVLTEIGEHHIVFIDRGRSHGVQQGSTFAVLARGDGYTRETTGLPNEDIGQLMVIDVQDNAATAIVTASLRELGVGDKIEMRRN